MQQTGVQSQTQENDKSLDKKLKKALIKLRVDTTEGSFRHEETEQSVKREIDLTPDKVVAVDQFSLRKHKRMKTILKPEITESSENIVAFNPPRKDAVISSQFTPDIQKMIPLNYLNLIVKEENWRKVKYLDTKHPNFKPL